MIGLRYVTFCGIDSNTPMSKYIEMSKKYPFIEWAVRLDAESLTSTSPSEEWIRRFSNKAKNYRLALHLGEQESINIMAEASGGRLRSLAANFSRIKLTINPKVLDHLASKVLGSPYIKKFVDDICGERYGFNECAHVIFSVDSSNHQIVYEVSRLLNGSKIEQLLPSGTPTFNNDFVISGCNYGFSCDDVNLDNIKTVLAGSAALADQRLFWLEVTSGLLTAEGNFDIDTAALMASLVCEFESEASVRQGSHLGTGSISVARLSGDLLDWWAAKGLGNIMMTPPEGWCRPMAMYRLDGSLYCPASTNIVEFMKEGNISLSPKEGKWIATLLSESSQPLKEFISKDPDIAVIRAFVFYKFGSTVPKNPGYSV